MILKSEPKHDDRENTDDDDEKYGPYTWWTTKYSNKNIA